MHQVLKWPLLIGDEHTYEANNYLINVKIDGVEKITVPAGTFDTYKMTLTGVPLDKDLFKYPHWKEVDWYAPELGFFIKLEFFNDNFKKGKNGEWEVSELLSYKKGDGK